MRKRAAFTLIEIIIVVGLLMLLLTYGFLAYLRTHRRQVVENAARETMVFLNTLQNNASVGNRGAGLCNNATPIENPLYSWQAKVSNESAVGKAQAIVVCKNASAGSTEESFTLPKGLTYVYNGQFAKITYSAVFGNATIEGLINNQIIVTDGNYGYRFTINTTGTLSNGCFCQDPNCNPTTDNEAC